MFSWHVLQQTLIVICSHPAISDVPGCIWDIIFSSLISSLAQTVSLYLSFAVLPRWSCFLSSDLAHCVVDFLLSVYTLKPGTLNWGPCFNAEDLLVLGGLFSVYFEGLFTRPHCSPFVVVHVRLYQQSQSLRFCVSLCLAAYLDSLLVSVAERHAHPSREWGNEKQDGNYHGKQLSLVK